jgi:hypothetical protein
MVETLKKAGVLGCSIFHRGFTPSGYFETEDLESSETEWTNFPYLPPLRWHMN